MASVHPNDVFSTHALKVSTLYILNTQTTHLHKFFPLMVRAHAPVHRILEPKRKVLVHALFGQMSVQMSNINETLKVTLGFLFQYTIVNNQETLKRVIKRGEIVAFVGSDPNCRIWIGSVKSDVDVTSETVLVSWLKYRRTSKGIVYLTQDAGEDEIQKSSCLGSVEAFNLHKPNSAASFNENIWQLLTSLAVHEAIDIESNTNEALPQLPLPRPRLVNDVLTLKKRSGSTDESKRLNFIGHCNRIASSVRQVRLFIRNRYL